MQSKDYNPSWTRTFSQKLKVRPWSLILAILTLMSGGASAEERHRSGEQGTRISTNKTAGIEARLDAIRLKNILFENVPLREIIDILNQQAKENDPQRRGVPFLLSPGIPSPEEFGAIHINVRTNIESISVGDLLQLIVRSAEKPISYSVEAYGVVFSFHCTEKLYVRVLKVDPKLFPPGIASTNQSDKTAVPSVVVASGSLLPDLSDIGRSSLANADDKATREFLLKLVGELKPPKSVFVKPRDGTLVVRATLEEIQRIEAAIKKLENAPPPNKNR